MSLKPVLHLLVDTTAFIKLSQLHDWSDNISTVSGVLGEVKNRDSRVAIASLLPYELSVNNPSEVSIKHVIDFAKKTGDFPALSRTDLELIAATYQFECIHGISKGKNLNSEPKRILEPEPISYTKLMTHLPAHQIGFYNGKTENKFTVEEPIEMETAESMEHSRNETNATSEDEQGWITPSNLNDVTTRLGGILLEAPSNITVACLTSDYSIQNVLLQMGLNVLSSDGLRVTQVRRYALQCRVCSHTTVSMETEKCPECGYNLLIRVQAITSDGMVTYQALSAKQFSKRGLRYSTAKPTGGRHGNVSVNPRNKPRYTRTVEKVNPLDADYIARESPFKHKDVNSRGANIGFKMGSRNRNRNPNEVAKKGTRKKQARV